MPLDKKRFLSITAYFFVYLLLYIILPLYLALNLKSISWITLVSFYLANLFVIILLVNRKSLRKYGLKYQVQRLQEKLNIIVDANSQERRNNSTLRDKIIRYHSLKNIIEDINRQLDMDSVAASLSSIAFSFVARERGVCVLYLVDNQTQRLQLFKAIKENKKLVIRAKEGDIFDLWVLRHVSPLLIEDIKKDFRFDLEKLKKQDIRHFSSLISCPFTNDHNFLGILRLDNSLPNAYSQDDLRFLGKICELGAVALENSQLFQKAQDLAIHDSLTSLYTKGYFGDYLKNECRRGSRQNFVFSLLMLDIDLFKNYNDKFGHTAGDIVLRKISQILLEHLKSHKAFVSRFGGEEFCIILPGIDKVGAFKIAEGICKRIEQEKIILRRQATNVTVSIGIAAFPQDSSEENELIQKSDRAMYEAKQRGRNQVCCI